MFSYGVDEFAGPENCFGYIYYIVENANLGYILANCPLQPVDYSLIQGIAYSI